MPVLSPELQWLKSLVQKYYRENTVVPAYDVSKREFGYGTFKKIDARHASFETHHELNAFLRNQSPLFISASVSEFSSPGMQPIQNKGLVGSDLIYEFDADDVPTSCKQIHDSWFCVSCGMQGKGRVLKCTQCAKGTRVSEWVCSVCLDATKKQTLALSKILQDDFGFSENELHVNFSGSKGYHVHVRSPSIFSLPKSARIELMDYLSLHEFDLGSSGFSFDGKQYYCPSFASAQGHPKRVLAELVRLIEVGTESEWMLASGSSPRTIKSFLGNRLGWYKEVLSGILPALPGKKTEIFWNSVLASIVEELRSRLDRQTSGDIYKLIRVPDTIHGSTGFLAKSLSWSQLPGFDPFSDAIAFSKVSERKLYVHASPLIRIGEQTLDPLLEQEVSVPGSLAAYLVGWGAAELR